LPSALKSVKIHLTGLQVPNFVYCFFRICLSFVIWFLSFLLCLILAKSLTTQQCR